MPVGVGAPWITVHQGVQKTPVNPYDRATIISIFPKRIIEKKVTIFPSYYILEPGSYEKPFCLPIGPASWWREMHEGMPLLEIPQSSLQVADSVVKDYVNCVMEYSNESHPGLFYVPGSHSSEFVAAKDSVIKIDKIEISLRRLLDAARVRQRNWYARLVKQADVIWARSSGNPNAINEDMRLAAVEMGYKDKPWLADVHQMTLTACPACGHLRQTNFPICANCKTVLDPAKFKELGLLQAS